LDAYSNYVNNFILAKISQLEVSWKRQHSKLLAKGIASYPQLHHKKFNILAGDPKQMPEWLTTGIRHLRPKSEDIKEPKKLLQITCLSTMYKTLTGIIARRISSHLEEHNLLPA
jgi:hypothetical protein